MNTPRHPLRLWVFSDLHQEWSENALKLVPPTGGFDVAVVAGDVATPLISALWWLRDQIPQGRIVYVPGNHDYYRRPTKEKSYTWEEATRDGHLIAEHYGIDLLTDASVEIDGVLFAGGTFWTDLRGDPDDIRPIGVKSAEARKGMNDYRRIHRLSTTRGHRRIKPEHTLAAHKETKVFIEGVAAAKPAEQRLVVVTHHPPSLRTASADLLQAYGSNLDNWASSLGADLWVHGHTHRQEDYRIGSGLRVVTNARGHGKEQQGFVPDLVVEV